MHACVRVRVCERVVLASSCTFDIYKQRRNDKTFEEKLKGVNVASAAGNGRTVRVMLLLFRERVN